MLTAQEILVYTSAIAADNPRHCLKKLQFEAFAQRRPFHITIAQISELR
jgi:hypothetical protein